MVLWKQKQKKYDYVDRVIALCRISDRITCTKIVFDGVELNIIRA